MKRLSVLVALYGLAIACGLFLGQRGEEPDPPAQEATLEQSEVHQQTAPPERVDEGWKRVLALDSVRQRMEGEKLFARWVQLDPQAAWDAVVALREEESERGAWMRLAPVLVEAWARIDVDAVLRAIRGGGWGTGHLLERVADVIAQRSVEEALALFSERSRARDEWMRQWAQRNPEGAAAFLLQPENEELLSRLWMQPAGISLKLIDESYRAHKRRAEGGASDHRRAQVLGKVSPELALALVEKWWGGMIDQQIASELATSYARHDPIAGWRWLHEAEMSDEDRTGVLQLFMSRWIDADTASVRRHFETLANEEVPGWLASYGTNVLLRYNTEEALVWAQRHGGQAIQTLVTSLAQRQPLRAAELYEEIEQKAGIEVAPMVNDLVRINATEAMAWIEEYVPPEQQSAAYVSAGKEWLRQDPKAVSDWLREREKDGVYQHMASLLSGNDLVILSAPEIAVQWASELSDENHRRSVTIKKIVERIAPFDHERAAAIAASVEVEDWVALEIQTILLKSR